MNLFNNKPAIKPVKIWLVRTYNQTTGELFNERAFRYRCEAFQFRDYQMSLDELVADCYEVMLY